MDSACYHLAHFRAEINTTEEFTRFDNIKPASTCAVDSESKVVEGNKQTDAATLGITAETSSLMPTASDSISRTIAKESSSTSRTTQEHHDGAISWEFIVDDHQQQWGLDMQELGTLPYVPCTFMGSSDDSPPPPAPDLFGVEVMSCWLWIPLKRKPLSLFLG